MDTDRNLLFGVLALQAGRVDASAFVEACSAWAGRWETPLAELLVERGWLTAEERAEVDQLLQRTLAPQPRSPEAVPAELTTDPAPRSLATVDAANTPPSLAGSTPLPPTDVYPVGPGSVPE